MARRDAREIRTLWDNAISGRALCLHIKPIPQDEQRVNIFDEAEARYWAKRFGCTRAQLESAVMKVGVMTKSVEKELKGK